MTTEPPTVPLPLAPAAGHRGYSRWTATGVEDWLRADILSAALQIEVSPHLGRVDIVRGPTALTILTPDEARLYGLRLIEAAALADRGAIRSTPPQPAPPMVI